MGGEIWEMVMIVVPINLGSDPESDSQRSTAAAKLECARHLRGEIVEDRSTCERESGGYFSYDPRRESTNRSVGPTPHSCVLMVHNRR